MTEGFQRMAKEVLGEVVQIRRTLHAHPELSLQEYRTAALVRQKLDELQIPWTPVETGTVATLQGEAGAPVVALRADMDALPVTEETGLPFSSEECGIMHACGHDGHTAMLLGAAKILKQLPNRRNTVKLIFQAAEECGKGARTIIDSRLIDDVDVFYASHLWPVVPYGKIYIGDGPVLAGGDIFSIRIQGRGGHGAKAYSCIDPIPALTAAVDAIHGIKALAVPGDVPLTVTVGRIQSGSVANVIPDSGIIEGTMRWFDNEVQRTVKRRIEEIARCSAMAYGAGAEVTFTPLTERTYNDEDAAAEARRILGGLYPDMVLAEMPLDMACEDFSYYREIAPAVMALIGCQKAETPCGLHNPHFMIDEEVLEFGTALYAGFAEQYQVSNAGG